MSLFGDLSESAIQSGLRRVREKSDTQRARDVAEILELYRGGSICIRYLLQRPGERDTKWEVRTARFALPNYLAFIVDYLARGIYGSQVMRTWKDGSDTENEALDLQLELNEIWDVQAELAQGMVAAGDAWLHVKFDEFDERLVLITCYPGHIEWESDPDNPQRIRVLTETRTFLDENDQEKSIVWVWVDDPRSGQSWGRVYDTQGNRLRQFEGQGFDPNPYGVIPYVRWKGLPFIGLQDGLSAVRDIASMQKLLVQKLSDLAALVLYQAHGQPVRIMGIGEDPNSVVLTGVDSMMTLANGGGFTFESPQAAINEVLDDIDKLIDMMFHTAQFPREAMSGGIAESGVALRIRWQPYISQIEAARMRARAAESRLGKVMGAIGTFHGIENIPEDHAILPEWTEGALPNDDVADRAADLTDLNNQPPLMTKEDYLLKWREGVDTPEDAKEYLTKILAEEPKPVQGRPDPGRFGLIEDKPEEEFATNGVPR